MQNVSNDSSVNLTLTLVQDKNSERDGESKEREKGREKTNGTSCGTRRRSDCVHKITKEIPNGHCVRVCCVLRPPDVHTLSVGVCSRVVGVDEGFSPQSLADTTAISVDITGGGGGGGSENHVSVITRRKSKPSNHLSSICR